MVRDDFWDRMRSLRASLADAGEQQWSTQLRGSLAPTAHGADHLPELESDLKRLRDSEIAIRLDLRADIDELLEVVTSSDEDPAAP